MKNTSDESASTKAIGMPSAIPPKKPAASSAQGAMACALISVFQATTAAVSAMPMPSVDHTMRDGPFTALASPNSVMNRLPIATGYT